MTSVGVLAERLGRDGIDVVNMAVAGHHLLEQISLFEAFTGSAPALPKKTIIVLNPLFIGGYDNTHKDTTVKFGELLPRANWASRWPKTSSADQIAGYRFFRDGIRKCTTAIP